MCVCPSHFLPSSSPFIHLSSLLSLFSPGHPPRVRSISGSRFSRRRLPTKAPPPFRSWWYWSVPCRVDAAAVAPSASLLLSRHFLGADYSTRVTHTRILRRSSVLFFFFSFRSRSSIVFFFHRRILICFFVFFLHKTRHSHNVRRWVVVVVVKVDCDRVSVLHPAGAAGEAQLPLISLTFGGSGLLLLPPNPVSFQNQ